jgi:serine/threonine-protein kinase
VNGSVLAERYRVEARIGSGGMAEVFRGVDPVLNRTVAIKTLLPQFARDAGFVARFRREAQAAARLNHPNIVGVYDTGADGDTQFIVMEFIEGRTLADLLASGRRPSPMQAVELAERVTVALAAAHAQGIVHRDIKPANIMVTRDGQVKVMDFGIARVQTVETAPQTSSVLGTPTYLSPEQAQGQPVDARSDLYSLGVVLYELLAGRPPFTGDSPVAIAYKQVNETPPPPSQLNPDVTPRLDAVVMKALAKNPANRYQTAAELRADLQRVRTNQEVEATPLLVAGGDATQVIARPQATQVLPPTEEPDGSGRKVWLGVLIGVLIVAILAGAGYLLWRALGNGDTPEPFKLRDVTGLLYPDAKELLEGDGLVVRRQDKPSDKPVDTVLKQDPKPDALVSEGDTITLNVAIAPTTGVVPDLRCKTVTEASIALGEVNLTLGTQTSAPSDDCETGQIIAQSVEPGEELPVGTPLDVTVASGPATVTVPDVTCLSFGAAKSQLKDIGLVAVEGGTVAALPQCPNPNRVAAQDPGPNAGVPLGSTVTLYLGVEVEPSPSPSG